MEPDAFLCWQVIGMSAIEQTWRTTRRNMLIRSTRGHCQNLRRSRRFRTSLASSQKKSDEEVRRERDAADALAEQARLEAAQRKIAIQQKLELLITKWKLPPCPNLSRHHGDFGRTKVADVWLVGVYATAKLVAAGQMDEPSAIVLPPDDAKKAADIPSWKPYQVAINGLTPEKVVEFFRFKRSRLTAGERDKQLASEPSDDDDAEDPDQKRVKKEKHHYLPWQWEIFVALQRSMAGEHTCIAEGVSEHVGHRTCSR